MDGAEREDRLRISDEAFDHVVGCLMDALDESGVDPLVVDAVVGRMGAVRTVLVAPAPLDRLQRQAVEGTVRR